MFLLNHPVGHLTCLAKQDFLRSIGEILRGLFFGIRMLGGFRIPGIRAQEMCYTIDRPNARWGELFDRVGAWKGEGHSFQCKKWYRTVHSLLLRR